jgi:hypothetical protein
MARADSDPASKCAKYLHNMNDEQAKVDDVVKNVLLGLTELRSNWSMNMCWLLHGSNLMKIFDYFV